MIRSIDESEGSKWKPGEDYVHAPKWIRHGVLTRSKWWERALARLFGKKQVTEDSGYVTTMYHWRGTCYIASCKAKGD